MSVVFAFRVCLEFSSDKSRLSSFCCGQKGLVVPPLLENERAMLPGNQLYLIGQVQKEFQG